MRIGVLDNVSPLTRLQTILVDRDETDKEIVAGGLRSSYMYSMDALAARIAGLERHLAEPGNSLETWRAYCGEVFVRLDRIEALAEAIGRPVSTGRRDDLVKFAQRTEAMGRPCAHTGEYAEADRRWAAIEAERIRSTL